MWKRGRRLFSTAAILMILTAAAHTAGTLAGGPEDAAEKNVLDTMRNYKVPLGMGMNPSLYDIYWDLGLTMSVTFAALGLINLVIAASASAPADLLRRLSWVNGIWVASFIALNFVFRVPPALISGGLIELVVVASLLTSKRTA